MDLANDMVDEEQLLDSAIPKTDNNNDNSADNTSSDSWVDVSKQMETLANDLVKSMNITNNDDNNNSNIDNTNPTDTIDTNNNNDNVDVSNSTDNTSKDSTSHMDNIDDNDTKINNDSNDNNENSNGNDNELNSDNCDISDDDDIDNEIQSQIQTQGKDNIIIDDDQFKQDCSANENKDATPIEKNIEKAIDHKSKGNQFYKLKAYDEAIDEYTLSIELCPEETDKDQQHLSIFYGNRAACFIALKEYEAALEDCNISLEYNETYIKALWRRAKISEKLKKHIDAQQDYKKILDLDLSQAMLVQPHIDRLQPLVEEDFERQKTEVVGKLKTFANWGLGKLGLSLDNFEAKQDPGTGSYNVQFNPNANANPTQNG